MLVVPCVHYYEFSLNTFVDLQEDEKVLQVRAEHGEEKALEESNRRKLPLELPLPPSFSSLFCKPKRASTGGGFQQP